MTCAASGVGVGYNERVTDGGRRFDASTEQWRAAEGSGVVLTRASHRRAAPRALARTVTRVA